MTLRVSLSGLLALLLVSGMASLAKHTAPGAAPEMSVDHAPVRVTGPTRAV